MDPAPPEEIALLLIIAGPAGSGKTTLCDRLVEENERVERLVTCTTRPPREGEQDGIDYYFLSDAEFDQKIGAGAFLEWAKVHDYRYGTLKSVIEEKLGEQIDLVMNIDVQGVESIRQTAWSNELIGKRLATVFVLPPNFDELRNRLRERGKDDEQEISRRIQSAEKEVKRWPEFDYVILSKSKDEDFEMIRSIWRAEKRRVSRLK